MLPIKISERNNIKVYNTCANQTTLKGVSQEYMFDGARNGVYPMYQVSFTDIQYANSRNPDLFVTGLLTFDESEQDEIYSALNHTDWRNRIWNDPMIEDALLHPTKAKMERILAVRDVLTIERIRGVMTRLINTKGCKPNDMVIDLVNGRYREISIGKKRTDIQVNLPESMLKENAEKDALKAKNDAMEEKLRKLEAQIAALVAAQTPAPDPEPPSKPTTTTRKKPG